jgi:ketosteroid isomerase-like protein
MKSSAETVKAMFDAISREDMAGLLSLFHDDIVIVEPESLPCGGTFNGPEAFRKGVLMVMGRKFRVRVLRCAVIGEGETVAASADLEFTSRASGRALVMPYVELHTIAGGKARRIEVYPQDTHRLVEFWRQN